MSWKTCTGLKVANVFSLWSEILLLGNIRLFVDFTSCWFQVIFQPLLWINFKDTDKEILHSSVFSRDAPSSWALNHCCFFSLRGNIVHCIVDVFPSSITLPIHFTECDEMLVFTAAWKLQALFWKVERCRIQRLLKHFPLKCWITSGVSASPFYYYPY